MTSRKHLQRLSSYSCFVPLVHSLHTIPYLYEYITLFLLTLAKLLKHSFFRSLFEEELAYSARLIEADVRNNSAWNHRFFAASGLGLGKGDLDFAAAAIRRAPGNESPWNYLRGWVICNTYSLSPRARVKLNLLCTSTTAW